MSRRFGICGGMGSGKSTLAGRLLARNLCRVVEVDDLRRQALWVSDAPRHVAMRARLADALGLEASGPGSQLDRDAVARRAFSGRDAIEAFAEATAPTLREDALKACEGDGPPAAIVWSRLVEDGYAELVDGPIGIVLCPPAVAAQRAATQSARLGDPLTAADARIRITLQPTDAERIAAAEARHLRVVCIPNGRDLDAGAAGRLLAHALDLTA